jgi:hypothetical protein
MGASATRRVEIDPERVAGWIARFLAGHGGGEVHGALGTATDARLRVVAADGASADLQAFSYDPLAVLLIRRGGYAVAVAEGTALVAHKVGTRHVQSRTAAGGWSQQRFARRRANQADALVGAVADHFKALLDRTAAPAALVVGGDKALVRAVLQDVRLRRVAELPRRDLFDIADPSRKVLDEALRRGRAVRGSVLDAPAG